MCRHLAILAVAIAASGCRELSTAPPTGLPVSLSYLTTPPPSAAVTGAGDSAVVSIPLDVLASAIPPWGCGGSNSVDAGIENGALIVTIVAKPPDPTVGYMCVAPPVQLQTVRAVVHQIPPGTYTAMLAIRIDGAAALNAGRVLASGVITLP